MGHFEIMRLENKLNSRFQPWPKKNKIKQANNNSTFHDEHSFSPISSLLLLLPPLCLLFFTIFYDNCLSICLAGPDFLPNEFLYRTVVMPFPRIVTATPTNNVTHISTICATKLERTHFSIAYDWITDELNRTDESVRPLIVLCCRYYPTSLTQYFAQKTCY